MTLLVLASLACIPVLPQGINETGNQDLVEQGMNTPISNLVWLDSNAFSNLIRHLLIPFTPIGQTDPGLSSGTEIG